MCKVLDRGTVTCTSSVVVDFFHAVFSSLARTTFHRPSPPPPPNILEQQQQQTLRFTSDTIMTFWDMDLAHAGWPLCSRTQEPNSKTTDYRLTLAVFHGSAAAMHMQQLRYFASARHATPKPVAFREGGLLHQFGKIHITITTATRTLTLLYNCRRVSRCRLRAQCVIDCKHNKCNVI